MNKNLYFYGQHSPKFIDDNTFVFYNNNLQITSFRDSIFNASIIKVKFGKKFNFTKEWEYEYKNNSFLQGSSGKEGYVQLLPNGNYLIGVGGHNNLIEVTENKKIVEFVKEIKKYAEKAISINENHAKANCIIS